MSSNGPVRNFIRFVRRHPRASEVLLLSVLLVASSFVLREPAVRQPFSVDESRWIATSRYFWTTFLERDLFGPAWQPNYVVLTQPPVARYLIGFGLWVQGWSPEQLNGRYDIQRDFAANRRAGNIPGPELLAAGRRVVFVFALGSMLMLYLIGRTLDGWLAGVVAVGLTLLNPLLSTLWTRALAEAPLSFFSLLTLLLGLRLLSQAAGRASLLAALGTGAALGLATATKLSGALGASGLAAFVGLQWSLTGSAGRDWSPPTSWLPLVFAAALVFVAVNPLLYPDPIGRGLLLAQNRVSEMEEQRRRQPELSTPEDMGARLWFVARRIAGEYASFRGRVGFPLDALLTIAGAGVAVAATWRDVLARRALGPPTLLLCWGSATYAATIANLRLDSPHYFAPLVTVNVLLEALAYSTALTGGAVLAAAARARRKV